MIRVLERRCHFNNPDLDYGYEAHERVCQRLDRHDGPHMGIVGRSRWVYPGQTYIPGVNRRTAEELIALADGRILTRNAEISPEMAGNDR